MSGQKGNSGLSQALAEGTPPLLQIHRIDKEYISRQDIKLKQGKVERVFNAQVEQ
jgi:hypothetical protein